MRISSSMPRSLLLAGAFIGVLSYGAAAQTATPPAAAPAAAPALPPGSPLIGRPDSEAAQKIAPVVGPPIATAADKLPLDKLKAASGFNVEVYAAGAPEELSDFAARLRQGPRWADVRGVEEQEAAVQQYGHFFID